MKKGYIVLENGQSFEGTRFGYEGEAIGEIVFNTSAVGYIETLTDEGAGTMVVEDLVK